MTLPTLSDPVAPTPLAALCASVFRDPCLRMPRLAALRAHDARHGSSYVATLRAYLDHEAGMAATAEELGVHVNTLRYRVSRVVALSGLDLADPDERLVCALELATGSWPPPADVVAPPPAWHPAGRMPVAVAGVRVTQGPDTTLPRLVALAWEEFGTSVWCEGVTRTVYAVAAKEDDPSAIESRIRELVRDTEAATGARLVAGIGPLVSSPRYAEASRRHADAVLRAVAARPAGDPVARLDDVRTAVVIERLAAAAAGHPPVDGGAVSRLAAHDRDRGTDYAGTLRAYLDCFGDVTSAARVAYVHPRTLRYRLRRVEEIGRLRLDDPADRLAAHLTLRLRST